MGPRLNSPIEIAPRLRYLGELDDPDDQAIILAADATCFGNDGSVRPNFDASYWWIIGEHDFPMAYAAIRPSRYWSDCAYLSRAGVLPAFRGHGLQRRLIAARVAWARRRGLSYVYTDVATWNHHSANSLIRSGFRLWSPRYKWSGDEVLYFSKKL